MSPTIKDVARLANTSKSTVSRYLNGTPVNPQIAEAIRKAIAELNYHPNVNARRLVMDRTQVIGVVVDDISNRFYSLIFKGIREVLNGSGYDFVFYPWSHVHEREVDFLRLLYEEQVDGLIYVSFLRRDPDDVAAMVNSGAPIVLIGDNAQTSSIPSVDVDNFAGIVEAVRYLHRLGHRTIAYITGPDSAGATPERLKGYQSALEELGLEISPNLIAGSNWTNEGGYRAMKQLLQAGAFTAVVASNDESAIGAMTCLQQQGYVIPRDLSVVGFDDIDIAQWMFPALTTVRQPFEEIGQTAAKLLMQRLQHVAGPATRILLKPELIVRNSSARPA
ncbi:MAG: LacI family transcriptional regulator [Alicyclobacillus sp.]|nr:LacI family transcriptional regulator [Alicyclobacillus sp.]